MTYFTFSEDDDYSENVNPLALVDDDFIGGYFEEGDSEPSTVNKKKVSTTNAPLSRRPTNPPKKLQRKPVVKTKATAKPVMKPLNKNSSPKPSTVASQTETPTTTTISSINQTILLDSNNTEIGDQTVISENIITKDIVKNEMVQSYTNTSTKDKVLNEMVQTSTNTPLNESEESNETKESDETKESNESKSDESNESSEETENSDPISDVVSEIIGENSKEETYEKASNDKNLPTTTEKQSKEIMDDVVDGVVDTLAGEESNESSEKSSEER